MGGTAETELSASLEDYLEAILQIIHEKQAVRAKDIGQALTVAKSSVTNALRALAERRLINYAPYDVITLTERGRAVAGEVARKHEVLRHFMVNVLAVGETQASAVACKMEHALPQEILDRLMDYVRFAELHFAAGTEWTPRGGYRCKARGGTAGCAVCMTPRPRAAADKKGAVGGLASVRHLDQFRKGEKAVIVRVTGHGGIKSRLMDMGVTAGTVVEVERVAPLGDPIAIKLKGYHLTLRKEEALRIIVTPQSA